MWLSLVLDHEDMQVFKIIYKMHIFCYKFWELYRQIYFKSLMQHHLPKLHPVYTFPFPHSKIHCTSQCIEILTSCPKFLLLLYNVGTKVTTSSTKWSVAHFIKEYRYTKQDRWSTTRGSAISESWTVKKYLQAVTENKHTKQNICALN